VYGPGGGKLALMNGQTLAKGFAPLSGEGAAAVYTWNGSSSVLSYYRHPDWLGSSRLASTPSRTVYYDGAYAPYGENYAEVGTIDRNFTGQNQAGDVGVSWRQRRNESPSPMTPANHDGRAGSGADLWEGLNRRRVSG
jgi:hypothetical protein